MISDFSAGGICLCYCDVERDCPHTDGDEPAGDWVTSHDSVHHVLVNQKSNAMLLFILFFTEENLVSFLCCCFTKVLQSHFTESKDVSSVPVCSCVSSWSFTAALSITICLKAVPFNITIVIVQAYAPRSDHDDNEIEESYDQLQNIIDQIPKKDILVVQGAWNGKWARMLVETGNACVDPSAMTTQMGKDSDFWSLPPSVQQKERTEKENI